MNITAIIHLLERGIVVTSDGKTLCRECGAWTVAADLEHNHGCEYVQAVKLLTLIDPPASSKDNP